MLPHQPSHFSVQHPPSQEHFEEARKIDVRPRHAGSPAKPAEGADASEVMLNFSCPACLEMLITAKSAVQTAVQCPECTAWVMPPKVVSVASSAGGSGKTMLPPPKKTGNQALRK